MIHCVFTIFPCSLYITDFRPTFFFLFFAVTSKGGASSCRNPILPAHWSAAADGSVRSKGACGQLERSKRRRVTDRAAAARTLERETDARMAGDQLESRRNMSTHFTPKGSLSSILHGRRYAPPPLLNPPAFRVHCGYVLAVRSAPTRPHRVLLFGHASITPTARTKGRRSWRLRFPFPT